MLSDRLQAIAKMVPHNSIVADIGTDHGYLPIALVKTNQVSKAYAMDINEGPLMKARENIMSYGLESQVIAIRSPGLERLPMDVNAVVIAGMGGILIGNILMTSKKKLSYVKDLILSPHLDVPHVRRTVHTLGYRIIEEKMIIDQEKYYTILKCKQGQEVYTDLEYEYGKKLMEEGTDTFLAYLEAEKNKLEKVIKRLNTIDTKSTIGRSIVLKDKYETIVKLRRHHETK
ncbi:tRNA (adenine(22)-N(1))-methyltransferase [Petrocella sp. FN5]|uniref:tRNA (adenine(22)-N(1))-methyltransferase n=1 Tax=Petrocella sp. FN5 TaxID=3032002 RepID=UPI0023DAE7CE|nr:class I SAM-dependent methyltransferase [Petrocella sp. FN5]MDF1616262.1 class I SAM-dependent methyltransferase [Petrocella sp. FN5]